MTSALHTEIDRIVETTNAFRILADHTRCRMLIALTKRKEGMCVYELAEEVGVSHSAASHQLAKLEARNIVSSYREGQSVCYSLADSKEAKRITQLLNVTKRFT